MFKTRYLLMDFDTIRITNQQAENILFEQFNVKGNASKLPGEIDFNFRVKQENSEGYILKISRPNENENYLDFQQKLLLHVQTNKNDFIAPQIIKDKEGKLISEWTDAAGNKRKIRLLTWISGRVWSSVNPQLDELRYSLGQQCGMLAKALQGFDHKEAHRHLDWDVAQSLWTKEHLKLFDSEEKEILSTFIYQFEAYQTTYSRLRKCVIHNDANDNNIVVSKDILHPKVKTLIDYGDSVYSQIINDLAVACAYAIMDHNDPLEASLVLVKGYHSKFPLLEEELPHLYTAIAMRLVISVTKSAINKIKEPQNEYLQISEKPAWELLKKWKDVRPDFAHYSFRQACGFTAHPNEIQFINWAIKHTFYHSDLFPTINKNEIHRIDWSVSSTWLGHFEEFNNLEFLQFKIDQLQKRVPNAILAGGYLEPRPIYNSSEYDKIGNDGRESRTVHLGIDYCLPENTPVHALFDGEVVIAVNDAGNKEYGGLVVLKHVTPEFNFYTLYGHLTVASTTRHHVGDMISQGEQIALLANYPENGNWVPHLHFQIMLSLLDYKTDFPGVAYHRQIKVWQSLCPDPNLLFKSKNLQQNETKSNEQLKQFRSEHLGKSLSLQYKTPIKMVRGAGQYIMDEFGRKYLDTVNNVAHVGHEHYQVVRAGQEQMALLNTNTRYLHETINLLVKALIETLPPELSVVHFVNSGSEANELAFRMAKSFTGEQDFIASEVGYHGNTNMCVDVSSYKFDGKGGKGAPEHTHIFSLPDSYRGIYRGKNTAEKYAHEVDELIEDIHKKGRGVAGLILEPIISCGGQIELPDDFLPRVYKSIRNADGICISDEVQTGCGRMGKTFWGFQLHDVIPDIVTIGKPFGNGHPVAAVVCTPAIAEKFANGMEYFNTFGGNPVSCAIALEVLKIIKHEKLQEHALRVGEFLKSELNQLSKEFPIIGDVRGQGLFLGFELVDAKMNPLAAQTDYLINRMKDHGILMSSDGPDHNVLKIKPPMVFSKENAKELIFYLRKILAEDFMRVY